jgi:hypothetical protein
VSFREKAVVVWELAERNIVTEARTEFGNPEEREYSPLEAVTRGLGKPEQTEETKCVLY